MSIKSSFMGLFDYMTLRWKGTTVGQALGVTGDLATVKPVSMTIENQTEYDPDYEFDQLVNPVMNPVVAFHEALSVKDTKTLPDSNPFKGMNVKVVEAWVFEAVCTESGQIMHDKRVLESLGYGFWPSPYRIRHVKSNAQYLETLRSAKAAWDEMPAKQRQIEAVREAKRAVVANLKEARLIEDSFDLGSGWDGAGMYDPNQYTEFAPLMAGPFNKQLYLTDYLKMHAYAFEAWNHNPVAKRMVELISQYTFGRRFKVRIKDKKKEAAWQEFDQRYAIREQVSTFWVREYVIYGEIMLNKETWQLIDPSTVWDIITDPDNLRNVYYYFQSYPTAYQMFTGYRVPGQPGSEKVPGSEYVIRQIPAYKIMHLKGNCVSNEKRGRSMLFPVLGWLKRIKDLYNAIVIRQWLMSCFIWDDCVKGSAADVQNHANTYSTMPKTGSTFVHNDAVERKPMPAIDSGGGRGNSSGIGEEIMAFIATAIGIPKEFFNVISTGGGSRATALTSAEPFTKVIEDIQAKFEALLIEVAKEAFAQAGLTYVDGDIEFIFPSVTKDTTSETIKNIGTGEGLGYISKRTAAEMFAAEMNITNYDFDKEQSKITDDTQKGLNQTPGVQLPVGRFGGGEEKILDTDIGDMTGGGSPVGDDEGDDRPSPIHGSGKVQLQKQLKRL